MGIFLVLNPDLVYAPADPSTLSFPNGVGGYALVKGLTQESIAVRTWVSSVLFCACVCFGNIGRQLAPGSVS